MHRLKYLLDNVVSLLFPELCPGCGADIFGRGSMLCAICSARLPVTNFQMHRENPVAKIFYGRLPLCLAMSHFYFTKRSPLQRLLHQFKYKKRKEIGAYLGRAMGGALKESPYYNDVEALVPLPLHYRKQKMRGYNQAAVLCEAISAAMGVPVLNDVVIRNSKTDTQTKKTRSERWRNIEGRFSISNGQSAEGKHLLLVDDVLTTGATLEACGSELLKISRVKLSVATLAYTSL